MQRDESVRTVHSYDTQRHRVVCGIPQQSSSTKHRAAVTCAECLRLLDDRTVDTEDAGAAAH
jgi:hypothetical protein